MSHVGKYDHHKPSPMGDVMATLLVVVDAWFEMVNERDPEAYQPMARIEVLAQLIRLLSRRFHGFSILPSFDDVVPLLSGDRVTLRIRSPSPVPNDRYDIAMELAKYGFHIKTVPHSQRREISVQCNEVRGAKILPFPGRRREVRQRSKLKR